MHIEKARLQYIEKVWNVYINIRGLELLIITEINGEKCKLRMIN